MSTRADRDRKAFIGPGNADGMVSSPHSIEAGIHDGTTWQDPKLQLMTVRDLMRYAGFHERSAPFASVASELKTAQLASVVKALELHTGMNYMHSYDYDENQYACEACCTCF
jgi:hypothetical protein